MNRIHSGNKKSKKAQAHKKESTKRAEQNGSGWPWFGLAAVLITAFAVYYPLTHFNLLYLWDDRSYITDNADIKNLGWENIKLFFTKFYVGNYQPLTMLLYAMEYKMGGGQGSVFHFTNILLHLLNTWLVFVFVKKISGNNAWVPLITAAFFAVHPMHVESVAWVSETKDVLYTFFFLLSLILYTRYIHSKKINHFILAATFFVLSCLSKSAAVVFPLIAILLDYYSGRKASWKTVIEKLPLFAVSLLFGIVAFRSQASSLHDLAPAMPPVERMAVISYSFISYLFKAIMPVNLSALYPYPSELKSSLPVFYYLAILGVALVLFFVWYSRKWSMDFIFGFLFFVITIVLVLQFIPVGAVTMADRYTYVPYIGLFFIVAKLYERLFQNPNASLSKYRKYSFVVLLFGFIVYASIAYGRVQKWENDAVLFSDVLDKYPDCSIAYKNRGVYYQSFFADRKYVNDTFQRETYLKKAVSDFENALKHAVVTTENWQLHDNLGVAKRSLGDFEGSKKEFDTSIELNPYNRQSYLNRGVIYVNYYANNLYANNPVEKEKYLMMALKDYESALRLKQNNKEKAIIYANVGVAKFNLGQLQDAVSYADSAISSDTDNVMSYEVRANAHFNLKNYTQAFDDFNKLSQLNPSDSNAIKNINLTKKIIDNKPNE
jgi:protein O-mannosyl-transferase